MITGLRICAASDPGVVRTENQDHYLVGGIVDQRSMLDVRVPTDGRCLSETGLLCAVADGMGGHRGGAVASRLALEMLVAARAVHAATQGSGDVPSQISQAVLDAHVAVMSLAAQRPDLAGMGSTIVGCHLTTAGFFAFHAGDSRLYRFRNGYLALLTEDHVIEGPGSPAPARVLVNGLGGGPDATCEPAVSALLSFREGEALLLCSDGLPDALPLPDMEAIFRAEADLPRCVYELVAAALARGAPDNVTVIAARWE